MSTRTRIATIAMTAIALLALSVAAAFAFIYSGVYDVSGNAPDNPAVAWMLHRTYEASLHHYGGKDLPPADLMSLENIRAGARLYDSTCVLCHGAPGKPLSPVGQGIAPAAPQLLEASRRNNPALMFWVIKHGVNMTAMPSFGKTQSDATIWQLAAFLYDGRGITKDRYDSLQGAN
jgi:mono/diheme cytochrome c family protein